MDSNSSDHSPPLSENAGSSWIQCWENEISSISGLNLGSNSELNSLVEDKEIAAKAVAFVDRYRPCSRCSQCSSTISNSPKFDKCQRQRISNIQHPSSGYQDSRNRRQSSPQSVRSRSSIRSGCGGGGGGGVTQAIIHPRPYGVDEENEYLKTEENSSNKRRKNSLPEMVSQPNSDIKRVSPLKVTKEVQCTAPHPADCTLEEQFMETIRLNSKLTEDLGAATKEIDTLKKRLKLLEMNQLAKKCTEEYHGENETQIENSENGNVEEHFLWMNSNNNNNKKNIRQPLLGLKSLNKVGSKYQRRGRNS
ncbi:hypothetical protein KUTeg_001634 [Tegillarca granosa]|uniref:Uncharacterized protein n=1 Tax=Tegillarca granosa TaxID=220873 RepID=A0ABQ9FS03_TEGGR|nr:hypothetical protein KUTeg_001634 [Tegillarca granosa]